ncbi:enhanced serine sensitivity protein SseB C-terminal domain-containing protein [Plantibacter sp. T3]|uniref:enhanced serine sensitivity protein SseB C-terminal domain-containing protein n=1 Tax=Plantibacter sp. T3 TaxID=2653161 RepID=UPI0012F0ECF4|nr:enhanced serine sensitivity protein SseB C-terminal domain-containing protein [Plantibacter sp. T3]VXB48103.1 putative Protein SseB [Plantibacter sp. T3]
MPAADDAPDAPDIEALLAAAADDRSNAPAFLTALLESTVIVAGTVTDDGMATLADLLDSDGSSVQPFYTSKARFQETLQVVPSFEQHLLALPCRVLWQMTRGARLVLNPHSTHGKEFLPGEVAQLLDGEAVLTPRVVERETEVMVGQPARIPPGMTETLTAVLAEYGEVDEAVLGWKVTPQEGGTFDECYLLVIVGAPTARETISGPLARALATYSASVPIDVMYVAPGAKHLLTSVPPFHRRKRGLFRRR